MDLKHAHGGSVRYPRVRLLLVEDDPDDCFLIRDLLSEIPWTSYEIRWVPHYDPAVRELGRGNYDVCLLDFVLGEKNGLELLKELGESCQTPIILMTGIGDHETDLEAMRNGAADFLNKADINPHTLERSIRYAVERGRFRRELEQTESRFRSIIEHVPVACYVALPDEFRTMVYVSGQAGAVLGIPASELNSTDPQWPERVHPADRENVLRQYEQSLIEEAPFAASYRLVLADGGEKPVRDTATVERDSNGNPLFIYGFLAACIDEEPAQGHAKAAAEYARRLFEQAPAALLELDFSGAREYTEGLRAAGVEDFTAHFNKWPEELARCAGMIRVGAAGLECLKLFGTESREELGELLRRSVLAEAREHFRNVLTGVAEGRQAGQCRGPFRAAPGETKDLLMKWSTLQGPDPGSLSVVACFSEFIGDGGAADSRHAEELMRYASGASNREELARRIAFIVALRTGCEAVAIRFRHDDDYPYLAAMGFEEAFVASENSVCMRDRDGVPLQDSLGRSVPKCLCGTVIRGLVDLSRPCYTRSGSFWTSALRDLLSGGLGAGTPPGLYGRCLAEGYQSIALIPLPHEGETVGLLQMCDRGKGVLSAGMIAMIESKAAEIGSALALAASVRDQTGFL